MGMGGGTVKTVEMYPERSSRPCLRCFSWKWLKLHFFTACTAYSKSSCINKIRNLALNWSFRPSKPTKSWLTRWLTTRFLWLEIANNIRNTCLLGAYNDASLEPMILCLLVNLTRSSNTILLRKYHISEFSNNFGIFELAERWRSFKHFRGDFCATKVISAAAHLA